MGLVQLVEPVEVEFSFSSQLTEFESFNMTNI